MNAADMSTRVTSQGYAGALKSTSFIQSSCVQLISCVSVIRKLDCHGSSSDMIWIDLSKARHKEYYFLRQRKEELAHGLYGRRGPSVRRLHRKEKS